MTQNEMVLAYMRENGKITPRDALKFGCFRLGARIHDLRGEGYAIVTVNRKFVNQFGRTCKYAEYRLVE